jgi:protein TonB
VQPAPVVAPQPKVADESRERTLMEQYQQTISARIKKFEEYPPVAKRRHWEGTTVVQLRLTAEGKVTDIAVVEKSGYEILDEAAVKMIRRASPLPLPPEGLRGRDHTVLVPIRFRLDS